MDNDSRTLLKKITSRGGSLPEMVSYSVIAMPDRIQRGSCSNIIYAQKSNGRNYNILDLDFFMDKKEILGVISEGYSVLTVLNMTYETAKKVAGERARQDKNKVIDLTGNVPVPEEAKDYIL